MTNHLARRLHCLSLGLQGALAAILMTTPPAEAAALRTIQTTLGPKLCWVGGSGAESIIDDRGVNCIQGRGGGDRMYGSHGADRIDAEGSESTPVRDDMYGGSGADTFYVDTGHALGDSRIDRIHDIAAGETICSRAAFGSWRRVVPANPIGTSTTQRYIVVPDLIGGEVTIAWVKTLGTKAIVVRTCYLTNE